MLNIRVIARFGAAYAALAAILALIVGSFNWSTFWRLTDHGLVTEGRLVEKRCEQHSTAKFQFRVAGRIFEGLDKVPNCSATQPGDILGVTYLPEAPTINLAGVARERLRNETISIALVAFFGPLLILFFLGEARRRASRKALQRAGQR